MILRAEDRSLVERLLQQAGSGVRLSTALGELSEAREQEAFLWRFLAIKEAEDRARMAHADRTRWHRQLSWALVRALFLFGIGTGLLFTLTGDGSFSTAVFFVSGGAAYYLCAQVVTLLRGRADDRALKRVTDQCEGDYAELGRRLRA